MQNHPCPAEKVQWFTGVASARVSFLRIGARWSDALRALGVAGVHSHHSLKGNWL